MKFVVKESNFSARVKSRWRYPRGKHSKVRQQHKGRPALPTVGYGRAAKLRHTIANKEPVVIKSISDLDNLNPEQIAVLARTLGGNKKVQILKHAVTKKISFLNLKDNATKINELESVVKKRKELTSKRNKKREMSTAEVKKTKEAEAKKAEKDKSKENTDKPNEAAQKVEDNKKAETQAAEKLITKRQ